MQGAVYVTDNAAYTWQAAVQETVDGTLNRTVSSGKSFCRVVKHLPSLGYERGADFLQLSFCRPTSPQCLPAHSAFVAFLLQECLKVAFFLKVGFLIAGISGASYYEGTFSNIRRAPDGSYVAVSSRGNFFLTWKPGEINWTPHNRPQ